MSVLVQAEPAPIALDPVRTALIIIDMQRDFLEPGGFGAALGNDVAQLAGCIEPKLVEFFAGPDGGHTFYSLGTTPADVKKLAVVAKAAGDTRPSTMSP